jgi:hypothetical protein
LGFARKTQSPFLSRAVDAETAIHVLLLLTQQAPSFVTRVSLVSSAFSFNGNPLSKRFFMDSKIVTSEHLPVGTLAAEALPS